MGGSLASHLSVYPVVGCNGIAPGRGNWDIWDALAAPGGHMHPEATAGGGAGGGASARSGGILARAAKAASRHATALSVAVGAATDNATRAIYERYGMLKPILGVVLSPTPYASPIWSMPTGMRRCPHQSQILSDYRSSVTAALDAKLPPIASLIAQAHSAHADAVALYYAKTGQAVEAKKAKRLAAPPSEWPAAAAAAASAAAAAGAAVAGGRGGGRGRPRLIYFVTRAPSHMLTGIGSGSGSGKSGSGTKDGKPCHRCLHNLDELARALASAYPGALVVVANPGRLPGLLTQCQHFAAKCLPACALLTLPRLLCIHAGGLPLVTQLALFRYADLLLGVHGSAFAWGVC